MTVMTETHAFPEDLRRGVYRAIHQRRDIRAQFRPEPIPESVLSRLLLAAHHAPSVGFMQPWDFILVRDMEVRRLVRAAFEIAHEREARTMPPEKRETYLGIKLEGILESPLNLCMTCDRERFDDIRVGRTAQPEMDRYSVVCAVQNLWLAARAEGIGVGWVSIVDPNALKGILGIPRSIRIIAYLCLGYVSHFPDRPELEAAGWLPRLPIEKLIRVDRWDNRLNGQWSTLTSALKASQE